MARSTSATESVGRGMVLLGLGVIGIVLMTALGLVALIVSSGGNWIGSTIIIVMGIWSTVFLANACLYYPSRRWIDEPTKDLSALYDVRR